MTAHDLPLVETTYDKQFAADVRQSLSRRPRELPSRYFYDALGSALFDAICQLPWYRITRAESRLLAAHGPDVHARLYPLSTIVELGPGNGEKLRLLLDAAGTDRPPFDVHLVDVSARALDVATTTLGSVQEARIVPHVATYDAGLRAVAAELGDRGRTLVVFLGSNIGNFEPACAAALLDVIRENLAEGDALLIGTDLVKPERELLLAYDDPLGVTASFNRNLLVRLNTELGADFDVDQFAHKAVWNARESRVEMHLVARADQRVRIAAVPMALTLRAGERIWTESSYKYRPDGVTSMLAASGFHTTDQWIDESARFALTLAEAR